MPRPFASATISFGLVSIPTKLYSATESSEKITFNMIHRECGSRVQQQYICPKDERPVDRTELAKGYEFSKGQYVLFTDEELKAIEEKATQSIDITEFLPSDQIDPIYFAKGFYLAPDRGAERAYTLLGRALQQTNRWALAKYAARGKQYLVVLRPAKGGIILQQLYYPNEIRAISELEIGEANVKPQELQMAVKLAELGAADEFHPENYRDEAQERIRATIQKKIDGEEITTPEGEKPQAQVIDLMEALRASLAGGKSRAKAARIPVREQEQRKASSRKAATKSPRARAR